MDNIKPINSIDDILVINIACAPVQDIEEFLGYQISADIMENLEDRIRDVLNSMSDEQILAIDSKFFYL